MNRALSQSDSDDFYAIKPAKSGNDMGWDVAVHRHGKPYRKSFTVHRYGSTEAALTAARAWRDEVVQSVRALTLAEYSNLERSNNTSGYPGVYLMRTTKRGKDGSVRVTLAWEARSPTGLKPAQKKSFAILKFGEDKAYELAVEARKGFVAQLDGFLLRRVPAHLREKLQAGNAHAPSALDMWRPVAGQPD